MVHLAQVNIGRMRYPLEDARMAGFVGRLDALNAVADASPGFVWRLQDDGGDATSFRVFDDPELIVNMSVWESVEALRAYTFGAVHRPVVRQRKQWFIPLKGRPHLALWWIVAGHRPTLPEAQARLEHLAAHGSTPEAFTFAAPFSTPAALDA